MENIPENIPENTPTQVQPLEQVSEVVEKKKFKFIDWIEWFLSVLVAIAGLVGVFSDSLLAGLFWLIIGGAVFVKQLRKYQGKGKDDKVTVVADKVQKKATNIVVYIIAGLVGLIVLSLIAGMIITMVIR